MSGGEEFLRPMTRQEFLEVSSRQEILRMLSTMEPEFRFSLRFRARVSVNPDFTINQRPPRKPTDILLTQEEFDHIFKK